MGVQVVFIDEAGAKQSGALEVLWRIGFEHVSPVRSFGSFQGQRSFQGSWWFATTGEHVGFESWVERDAVMLLDFDPDVVAVSSQPFCLRWAGQPGARRHVPDFFARLADGSALVIDVRPDELIGAAMPRCSPRRSGHARRWAGVTAVSGSSMRCWRRTCAGCRVSGIDAA